MSVETLTPATREEWLDLRRGTVGASEIAALFGAHPYQSEFEMWASKSGLLAQDPSESGAMRRGRHLESVAVSFLQEERPHWKVTANPIPGGLFYRDRSLGLSCTPDAFVVDPARAGTGVCQIKSVEPSIFRKRWKQEDGTVEIPVHVAIQAIQEAKLVGAAWAIVCPLVIGHQIDMPILEVPLHEGLWSSIQERIGAFWRRVEAGEAPAADYARDGDTINALWPPDAAGEPVDLTADNRLPELVDERDEIAARTKADKDRRAAIDAEIVEKLAGAPAGRLADGREITRTLQHRNAFTMKATTFPVIRVRKARKAAA